MDTSQFLRKAVFNDPYPEFRPRLLEAVCREVDTMRADPGKYLVTPVKLETEGGWKVRGGAVWDSEEGRHLMAAACQFASKATSQAEVHIRDRWANVMEAGSGWYSAPHSHSTADVAVVYALSEDDDHESPKGKLQFIDPRIPACCRREGFVSAALTPKMKAGDVIGFPGFITHWVTPYLGREDRITLAFNVGLGPAPDGPQHDMQQPVDLGKTSFKL